MEDFQNMHFLDDYLELLEPLTAQFQEDIPQIGELDKNATNIQQQMKDKAEVMFREAEKKRIQGQENINENSQIQQMYNECKSFKKRALGIGRIYFGNSKLAFLEY